MKNDFLKRHISIRSKNDYHLLRIEEIIFIERSCLKIKVHYSNHLIQEVDMLLEEIELKLKKYSFWRSNKNYLVNLKFLEKVSADNENTLLMLGHIKVPVEEGRKKLLMEELLKFQAD